MHLQIIADGTDPNIAKTMVSYITAIVSDYQQQILPEVQSYGLFSNQDAL
jgi:ABC-2 type transport system permease protein